MNAPSTPIRNVLTIAGSDSGGGAGIQADLKTFSAHRAYGCSVITALTAQNTREVRSIYPVSPTFIGEQIDAVCDDIDIAAVKIGMLSDAAIIAAVADGIRRHRLTNIVLDPVMVAKSGDKLLADTAITALREQLLPCAQLMTPNVPEAAVLCDADPAVDAASMQAMGQSLLAAGCQAVLMKGGHLAGTRVVDILVTENDVRQFAHQRVNTRNTHGTGCSLSAAIAANLANGQTLTTAVANATDWLVGAIRDADQLDVGGGHGPVHHFHQLWKQP